MKCFEKNSKMFTRLLSFFMMLCLCLSLCSLSAWAEEDVPNEAVEWAVSDDGLTLSSGYETYTYFRLPFGYRIEPHSVFVYNENTVWIKGRYVNLRASSRESGLLWDDAERVYLTGAAEEALSRFLDGEVSRYRLEDRETDEETLLSESTADALFLLSESGGGLQSFDVADLYGSQFLELVAYDSTDSVCTSYGAVFLIDEEMFYLHYLKLGNEYFTADGEFSFRSGTVEAVKLDDSLTDELWVAVDQLSRREREVVYESETLDQEIPKSVFWVFFVICGFVFPIVPLVAGLLLPRSAKRGYPKFWYLIAVGALLWMVFAAILMLVLILI